jgi:hypothetical protein
MTMTQRTHATTDLNVASYLVTKGFPLVNIERAHGGRCTFHLAPDTRDAARGFYADGQVSARAFANSLRDLKTLIREM